MDKGSTQLRKDALNIINSGLDSIKTSKIIKKKVKLSNGFLTIKNRKINLDNYKRIFVIGFGKASSLMGKELENIMGKNINGGLIISTKKLKLKKIEVVKGTHPYPTKTNIKATKKIVNLLKKLNKNDLVLCLVSGGGSSLLCYPKMPLKKYMKDIHKHFASGIDIVALNKIRKRLSNVKGGKLAKLTKARIVSLIFSDVVGDDLSTIASGPTYGKGLKNVTNILLLNNMVALESMKKKALILGYRPVILSNKIKGEASLVGKNIIKRIINGEKSINKKRKIVLLFAGETTVTVKGKGLGGRNQELCLGAMDGISKLKNCCLVSIGSDGREGLTNAAGAIVDDKSLERANKLGLDYKKYLKNNDSYHFFKKMDDLVITGLTGSNVADIGVLVK